jgi:hypothetical protein
MYKLIKNLKNEVSSVNKTCENNVILSIPFDPDNTDYQQYLKWVEEGNTPLPADEGAA